LEIDTITYSAECGILSVKCSGKFGVGSGGNPSAELLMGTIKQWMSDHPEQSVTEIEIDYTRVDYAWGDGPVWSMVGLLDQGVDKFRLIGSSSNCDSLKGLLEGCRLPWFELLRIDEIEGKSVVTSVPLKGLKPRTGFE